MTAPSSPPKPAPGYQPAPGLAAAALALASTIAVLQVAAAATAWTSLDTLRANADLAGTANDTVTAYDVLSIPTALALIAGYIVSCRWLSRARHNALALNPTATMRRGTAWVWLGWVVPVANLYVPRRIVDDVRRATTRLEPDPLWPWWTAWLVYFITGAAATRLDDTVSGVASIPVLNTISAVGGVIALVFWISIVRSIERDQSAAA